MKFVIFLSILVLFSNFVNNSNYCDDGVSPSDGVVCGDGVCHGSNPTCCESKNWPGRNWCCPSSEKCGEYPKHCVKKTQDECGENLCCDTNWGGPCCGATSRKPVCCGSGETCCYTDGRGTPECCSGGGVCCTWKYSYPAKCCRRRCGDSGSCNDTISSFF